MRREKPKPRRAKAEPERPPAAEEAEHLAPAIEFDGGLPEGWVGVRLGQLLREPLRNGKSAKASPSGTGVRTLTLTAVTYGDFSVKNTKVTAAQPEQVADLWLEPGDLLIERSNTPELVGTTRIFPGPRNFAIYPDLMIRARVNSRVLPQYAELVLRSPTLRQYFRESAQGTAGSMPKIDQGVIADAPIPLPPTLDDQRRIVAKVEEVLSHVNAAREHLARAPAILKRFRQSVLAAACSGALTQGWRAKHAATSSHLSQVVSAQDLPDLPESWQWSLLGAFLKRIQAGRSFRCIERPPGPSEIGVVKVSAVTWGEYDEQESKTCPDASGIESTLLVSEGDFLFSRANTIELVGACVIAKHVTRRVMLSDKILRFSFEGLAPRWALCALRGPIGRSEIERLATGNQQSMRNIGQDRMREIRIPVPPLREQDEVVRRVDALFALADAIEQRVADAAARADGLTQATLSKAFRGELADGLVSHQRGAEQ